MGFYSEYKKCEEDCVYFVENYLDIKLQPYQKGMLWNFQENRFFLVNACRQSGKTLMLLYFSIWYALFHNDKNILILSNKSDCSDRKSKILRDKIANSELFDLVTISRKDRIELCNGSGISFYGGRSSPCAVRGRRVDILGLDEPAYMDYFEELWPAIYPIVSSCKDGKVILTGTRNKVGDIFDEIYIGSITGENGWRSMTVNWWDIPGRDLKWKKSIIESLGEKTFNKEYTSDF